MGFKTNKYKEILFFNNEEIDSDDGKVYNLLASKFSNVLLSELPLGVKVQLCDKIIGSKELTGRSPYAIFEKIKKKTNTSFIVQYQSFPNNQMLRKA